MSIAFGVPRGSQRGSPSGLHRGYFGKCPESFWLTKIACPCFALHWMDGLFFVPLKLKTLQPSTQRVPRILLRNIPEGDQDDMGVFSKEHIWIALKTLKFP